MKFNKIMIFSILLIAILTLSAVSASEDMDLLNDMGDDSLSIDEYSIEGTNPLTENEIAESLGSDRDSQIIQESADDEIIGKSVDEEIIQESADDEILGKSVDEEIIQESAGDEILQQSVDEEMLNSGGASGFKFEIDCPKEIVKGSVFNEDITVNLPFDAFGTLKLIADGKELIPKQTFYRDEVTTYVFNLSSLPCKKYNATLVYSGDGKYPSLKKTLSFNLDYKMDIFPDSYTSQKNVGNLLYADLPDDFPQNKTITLKVGDKTFYAKTIRGQYDCTANFDLSSLEAGTYDAQVIYGGDSKYPAKTVNIKLNKKYAIKCNTRHDIFEDTYVYLKLPKNATGSLKILVDGGKIYNKTISFNDVVAVGDYKVINHTIKNTVIGLCNPEEREISFSYIGDDYQVAGSGDSESTDPRYISIYPRMTIPDIYVGQDANFTFQMPKDAKGKLLVIIGKKVYYNATLKNGKASFKLPNTKVGDYYFYYEYQDSKYGNSRTDSDLSSFRVMGKKPNLKIAMPSQLVKNCYNVIKFTFPNKSYKGTLKLHALYANHKSVYYNVTIVNGTGSVKILPKYQGKIRLFYTYVYKHYAVYDEPLGDFKVFRLTAKKVTMKYASGKKLTVKIFDNHNKPVKDGQVVKFYLKGKKIGTAKTKNGIASFKIKLAPKTYKIKVYYKGAYVYRKVVVKSILKLKAVKVKKSAKKLVLTASLKKVNGKYLKGKNIKFKFNGKTYKAKTNKKGVAKVTIKSKALRKLKVGKKIKIQATYIKNTVKRTVKVRR